MVGTAQLVGILVEELHDVGTAIDVAIVVAVDAAVSAVVVATLYDAGSWTGGALSHDIYSTVLNLSILGMDTPRSRDLVFCNYNKVSHLNHNYQRNGQDFHTCSKFS